MANYNNNNRLITLNEKYEISGPIIDQENYNNNNEAIQSNHTNNHSYQRLIGKETIDRLQRIQQYDKAFEKCLKQPSGLQSWHSQNKQALPEAPLITPRHHTTNTTNPLKRLLHLNHHHKSTTLKIDIKNISHPQPLLFKKNTSLSSYNEKVLAV